MKAGDTCTARWDEQRSWAVIDWSSEDAESVILGCVGDSRRKVVVVRRMMGDVTTRRAIVVVAEAAHGMALSLCTDSWGVRRDSWGLDCRAGRSRKFVAADPMAR
jgi:hypothetical protein